MKKLIKNTYSFFCSKKEKQQQMLKEISPEISKECFAYLNGEECSDEIKKRIEHYLSQDSRITKKEAVEMLLDFEERELRKT